MTGLRFSRCIFGCSLLVVLWILLATISGYEFGYGHFNEQVNSSTLSSTVQSFNNQQPAFEGLDRSIDTSRRRLNETITPKNISGYYIGKWQSKAIGKRLKRALVLSRVEGEILMEVRADGMPSGNVHPLHGGVVLKKGMSLTDDDIRFSLEGMYFPDVERLTGVLKPHKVIEIAVNQSEIDANTPSYRAALRREAKKWIVDDPFGLRVPIEKNFALKHHCVFHIDMRLAPINSSEIPNVYPSSASPAIPANGILLNGTLTSPNCHVTLLIEAPAYKMEQYYTKAVHYTLVVAILTFLQILVLIKQIEGTSTPATSRRVSILTIGQQTVMDAYLCLIHLTAGIVIEPLFNAFAMVSFFEFVLFAIFEMRYILLIWRAQRGQSNETWDTRRELSALYTRFYGVLLLGIVGIFRLQKYIRGFVFLLYSFWIPQIIHCIRSDLRQPLKPFFIIGMSISRLILPLYFYGCSVNVLGIKPNPLLCLGLVFYVALQAVLLLVQHYYGPHCFLPKRFLPHKHDYFRSLDQEEIREVLKRNGDRDTGDGTTECVICMNSVELGRPMARMVTPCNHFFHPQCLQRWMDVKMECPTCRQMLPPL